MCEKKCCVNQEIHLVNKLQDFTLLKKCKQREKFMTVYILMRP